MRDEIALLSARIDRLEKRLAEVEALLRAKAGAVA
jgi:BMFP domain-containing protein YqiC